MTFPLARRTAMGLQRKGAPDAPPTSVDDPFARIVQNCERAVTLSAHGFAKQELFAAVADEHVLMAFRWQSWQRWQSRICILQTGMSSPRFKSHPLRQFFKTSQITEEAVGRTEEERRREGKTASDLLVEVRRS